METYRIRVNGTRTTVEAHPDTPLLWVLRDRLGLRGTKFGCGAGYCGACTVHLDGQAVQSCLLPVSGVTDRNVTTIEGLAEAGGDDIQRAWEEEGVPQCGYCQAGQIMRAAALLENTPDPDEDDIRRALALNLCRCGTYQRIVRAVLRAAAAR